MPLNIMRGSIRRGAWDLRKALGAQLALRHDPTWQSSLVGKPGAFRQGGEPNAAQLRSHLRGNLVACLALFAALGGTSYAAATGSIDSREIKNNSIRSSDIRNKTIRSKDLRRGSATSRVVKNGSLLSQDFKAGQLPAGARGSTGGRGPAGSTGSRGQSNGYFDSDSGAPATLVLPPGRYIIVASFYGIVNSKVRSRAP